MEAMTILILLVLFAATFLPAAGPKASDEEWSSVSYAADMPGKEPVSR